MDNYYHIHDLTKAYFGDAIYSMYVRKHILEIKPSIRAHDAHVLGTSFEKATSQAQALERLQSVLSEEEKEIVRRATNKKSKTKAKNATAKQYNDATGLEALVGVLYLNGEFKRLDELFEIIMRGEEDE